MAYELVKTVIQKILQDKILLGLVIIGVLGIFVGANMGDDKGNDKKETTAAEQQAAETKPADGKPATTAAVAASVQPTLAKDFISWWITAAMDYNAATAAQSHVQALQWMSPDAAREFANTFWTPQIAESVTGGRLVAAFQPTAVAPQAINPDGSVVVGVAGTMVVQSSGQPVSQQFAGSFLVRQEKEGLRVCALDTSRCPVPGATVY